MVEFAVPERTENGKTRRALLPQLLLVPPARLAQLPIVPQRRWRGWGGLTLRLRTPWGVNDVFRDTLDKCVTVRVYYNVHHEVSSGEHEKK